MTIKGLVDEILRSDAYIKALDGEGDKDLEILLIQFGYIVYQTTKANLVRTYGTCKFQQTEFIKQVLKDMEPPTNLQINTR